MSVLTLIVLPFTCTFDLDLRNDCPRGVHDVTNSKRCVVYFRLMLLQVREGFVE